MREQFNFWNHYKYTHTPGCTTGVRRPFDLWVSRRRLGPLVVVYVNPVLGKVDVPSWSAGSALDKGREYIRTDYNRTKFTFPLLVEGVQMPVRLLSGPDWTTQNNGELLSALSPPPSCSCASIRASATPGSIGRLRV